MTAPRRPRSAWLLVGSTPSVWVKVHSAGQRLSRFLAKRRWYFVLALFSGGVLEQGVERVLEWDDLHLQPGTVGVGLVAVPGGEEVAGDPEAVVAEPLLLAHAFAVGGEVPE